MAPIMKQTKEQRKEHYKEYRLKNIERERERSRKYASKNREARRKYNKEHYLKNKEHKREYALKNKEHISKRMREYRLKNKNNKNLSFHIERRNKYIRNRKKTDPIFKLTANLRRRTLLALKGQLKSAPTMKLIGCTVDELRRHIESQFEPWMTWKNHGLWHMDHIKPCAKFDLTDPEQQRICFNWSNLQPLERMANLRKGAG